MDGPAIYPVSGGSEAIETALKLARAYHLARGETERWIVISRWGSYHGNTLGALDLSGRGRSAGPYEGWLGRFRHVSAAYPYRDGEPGAHAIGDADELAAELERTIEAAGPGTVAAFVAEPIVGATLAAAVPPDGYWPAIAEVCRRHGVLAHRRRGDDRVRADRALVRVGPLGRPAGHPRRGQGRDVRATGRSASRRRPTRSYRTITDAGPFVHGFTYSHSPVGAAVAREVLRILEAEDLVAASAAKGERLRELLATAWATTRTSARSAVAG